MSTLDQPEGPWGLDTRIKRGVGGPQTKARPESGALRAASGKVCEWLLDPFAEEGSGGPEDGGLTVEVSGAAFALVVVLEGVLLAGSFADLGNVMVLVDV